MTHTRGPWSWRDAWGKEGERVNARRLANEHHDTVLIAPTEDIQVLPADAHLIAAAPDLLECVRYAVESLDIGGEVRAMFEDALEKASVPAKPVDQGEGGTA